MPDAKRPPTDFELLRAIYDRHRDELANSTTVLVPIDIPKIADELGVDFNSVFGRLYHHLDPLYGHEPDQDGRRKPFFVAYPGDEPDRVNFPLLEAVLAGIWEQRDRDRWVLRTALLQFLIGKCRIGGGTMRQPRRHRGPRPEQRDEVV